MQQQLGSEKNLMPILTTALFCTRIYTIDPNARVRLSHRKKSEKEPMVIWPTHSTLRVLPVDTPELTETPEELFFK